ncbi:predicted protein, partial [Nematostella vectensis]
MSKDNLGTQISLAVISMCGMTMNALVCYIVYKHRTMRNYTNCLVVSLACSDVIMAAVLFCQYLISFHSPTASNILYAIAMFSGIANLCAVTFDRHTAVTQPLRYLNLMSRYFRRIVVCVWIGSIVLSVLPVLWVGEGSTDGTTLAHKVYIYVLEICGVVIPFIFIFSVYCYIFRQVRKCNQKISREMTDKDSKRSRHKKLFAELKVARVFVIVSILFLLSWVPILYVTTVNNLGRRDLIPDVLILLAFYALALGSIVNPVIYCFMKPDFKAAIRRIMLRRCEKAAFRASYSTRT